MFIPNKCLYREEHLVKKAGIFMKAESGKYHDIKVIQADKIPVKNPDTGPLVIWLYSTNHFLHSSVFSFVTV
jgi:hypothetical protein